MGVAEKLTAPRPFLLRRGIRLRRRRQVGRRAKRGALRSKVARARATQPPERLGCRHQSPPLDRMNMTSLPLSACVTTPERVFFPCRTVTSNASARTIASAQMAIAATIQAAPLTLMPPLCHISNARASWRLSSLSVVSLQNLCRDRSLRSVRRIHRNPRRLFPKSDRKLGRPTSRLHSTVQPSPTRQGPNTRRLDSRS